MSTGAGTPHQYALLWFLVNDRIKLLAYRIFDPVKKSSTKLENNVAARPDAKAEVEAKPVVEPKPKAKTTADLTPQIAALAYELYEREGHRDGQSVANWEKAEQKIRATQAKAEPKLAAKAEVAQETNAQPTADTNSKPAVRVEPTPESKTAPTAEVNALDKPEPNVRPAVEVSPQLVKRFREFYGQWGREDVRAVEESDRAKQMTPEGKTKK